jgi:hypothetical protein
MDKQPGEASNGQGKQRRKEEQPGEASNGHEQERKEERNNGRRCYPITVCVQAFCRL